VSCCHLTRYHGASCHGAGYQGAIALGYLGRIVIWQETMGGVVVGKVTMGMSYHGVRSRELLLDELSCCALSWGKMQEAKYPRIISSV
jgi:hypothetical protein